MGFRDAFFPYESTVIPITAMTHTTFPRILIVLVTALLPLITVGLSKPARAVTGNIITVTTTDDEVNSDGDCSLREAINAANTDQPVDTCPAGSGADTIALAQATYLIGTVDNVSDGHNGLPSITTTLSIIGNGAVIQGSGAQIRFFHVVASGALSLYEMTLTGGAIVGATGSAGANGTVFSQSGGAGGAGGNGSGGALYNLGVLRLEAVTLINNSVIGGVGGRGGNGSSGANGGRGGPGGSATGGAIYNAGELQLTGVASINNNASGGSGGNGGSGSILPASGGSGGISQGGAVYNAGGRMTIVNSLLTGNGSAGGAAGIGFSIGPVFPAVGQGGAIYNSAGSSAITNTTMTANQLSGFIGTSGGALYQNGGELTLENSILANSTSATFDVNDCFHGGATAVVTQTHNLIELNTGCPTPVLSSDPQLGPLVSNGGKTQTQLPAATSPVINAGNPDACPAVDQRGFAREAGPCDIGSVELGAATIGVLKLPATRIVLAGEPVTYTLQISNTGARTARSVVLTDAVPVALTFVAASTDLGACATMQISSAATWGRSRRRRSAARV